VTLRHARIQRLWGNTVSERGDLNTETGEISPDRGNHAIKVTERGERARVFRDVFAIWSATWPVHGRAAGAEHLLPRRCAASVTTRVDQLPQPTGSKTSWPTATSRASPPSSATRPDSFAAPDRRQRRQLPVFAGQGHHIRRLDRRGDDFDQRLPRVEPRRFELRRMNHVLRHARAVSSIPITRRSGSVS